MVIFQTLPVLTDEPTVRGKVYGDRQKLGQWLCSYRAHGSRRKAKRISNLFFAQCLKERTP